MSHVIEARFMTRDRPARLAWLTVAALLMWTGAQQPAWAGPPAGSQRNADHSACDRAAFRVVVDVGHTAEAPGAKSARGVYEYEFNLQLAKLIKYGMLEAGFENTILLVTEGPSRKGLTQRVAKANASGADLFLSIHHDSVPDSFLQRWEHEGQERYYSDRFKGHSIFISDDNADPTASLLFGQLLGQQLKARQLQYTPHYTSRIMGSRQRLLVDSDAGVYRYDQLIVLKNTEMPAVLLEAGSIINRDEELLMGTPQHQGLIGAAAVDAVEKFCELRRPRNPTVTARRPGSAPATAAPVAAATPKQSFQPAAAATRPANPAPAKPQR